MSISLKTHKKLWGHAANRCAFEDCRRELTEDTDDATDHFTLGDEAHIISERVLGPRHEKDFPIEQIDKYDNLILLCKIHHKKIDSDVKSFPADKVRAVKKNHEQWVTSNLTIDVAKQRDDEFFGEYIDKIEELAHFDIWQEWTQHFQGNGSFPRIKKEYYNDLEKLHQYISGRVHPVNKQNLLKAILLFNRVLEDFINEFHLFMGDDDSQYYRTQQLYKINAITVERQQLHEAVLEELIIELTKAGNHLSKTIRETFFPKFRSSQGILLLYDYPSAGKAYRRFEYKGKEKYPGFHKITLRAKKYLKMA